MSPRRSPASPPELPGFEHLDVLGSGGFADVYLYEQQLPRRRVAVKVLLTDRMSSGSVAEFTAEANVMAMLSTHPAIVTIYQAGVAADGRPYLVMEYCPKPNLQVRYRRERFSVAEALRVGVQVAGAVETAHRAGVLHRDIKPANILVTEYNRPALTDFGIASTTNAAAESAGLSIPWSPPESFADVPHSDARSDVYALGATVYSLLAGRSPFEVPGRRNTAAELIQSIETAPLTAIDRQDVPASLQQVLARAMARPAADRYQTALAFARALQTVQIELALGVTPVDILDDGAPEEIEADAADGLTRVRGVVSIDPQTTPAAGLTRPSATTAPAKAPTAPTTPTTPTAPTVLDERVVRGPVLGETIVRTPSPAPTPSPSPAPAPSPSPAPAPSPPSAPAFAFDSTPEDEAAGAPEGPDAGTRRRSAGTRRRIGLWVGVAAAAVVVLAAVVVVASLPGIAPAPKASPTAVQSADPQDVNPVGVPAPAHLAGAVDGKTVVFTWQNPAPHSGDRYAWSTIDALGASDAKVTTDTTVTVPVVASGPTCVQVQTIRSDGTASAEAKACAP